jgi:DNA-binding GntR family transcriptional regulator
MKNTDIANLELKIEQKLLREQAVDILRDAIISGTLPPQTKLIERQVARMLGTSRIPARDALLALEHEGLVVNRNGIRTVIQVDEKEISELYLLRRTLEPIAVELACDNAKPQNCALMFAQLERMRLAIVNKDGMSYRKSDLDTHRAIWELADNGLLLRVLDSLMKSIYMVIVYTASIEDSWPVTLASHQAIVENIARQDKAGAIASMQKHIDEVFERVNLVKLSHTST